MKSGFEIDGIDTDEEDDDLLSEQLMSAANRNDRIGSIGVYVDRETLRAYREYLKDWRWRMSTFRTIEAEIMGRPSRAFSGERLV